MTKKTKIILSLVVVLIILICVTVYYSKDYVTLDTKNISKLNDPNLIYSSKYWEGLCANEKGEGGGCYSELYFYNNGKLITKSGFTNQKTGENSDSTIEKDLGVVTVNQFIKSIKDSRIMSKNCPAGEIMDAGWDYQVSIEGVKKTFHNIASDCRVVFDNADKFLNDLKKIVKSNTFTPIEDNVLSNDLSSVEFVYSESNGSLPPPYHRKNVLTITESSSGDSVIAELVTSDYKDVLKRKNIDITVEQFKDLVDKAGKIEKENDSINAGCTGGTSQSIKISRKNVTFLDTSNYNCAGKSTNESLLNFSKELGKIISADNLL